MKRQILIAVLTEYSFFMKRIPKFINGYLNKKNKDLNPIIETFIAKNPEIPDQGRCLTDSDLAEVDEAYKRLIPDWYIQIMTKYPLMNIII